MILSLVATWSFCVLPPPHSYRQRAQKLSEIHKDQPGHPVNRTVYWIDYILRHNGAHHLRAAVHQISFCQYFLLDVAFVLLLGAALFYFLLSWVTKFIYSKIKSLWSRNKHSTVNGHYHNGIPNGKYKRNGHIKHEKKVKWANSPPDSNKSVQSLNFYCYNLV